MNKRNKGSNTGDTSVVWGQYVALRQSQRQSMCAERPGARTNAARRCQNGLVTGAVEGITVEVLQNLSEESIAF